MIRAAFVCAIALLQLSVCAQRAASRAATPVSTVLLGLTSASTTAVGASFAASLIRVPTPHVSPNGRYAFGTGVAVSHRITKRFAFHAYRTSSRSSAATGHALLIYRGQPYPDFVIAGPVRCLYVVGNRAVIGITIQVGTGSAATRIGESFYITVADGRGRVADGLDNSGYTNTKVHNCYRGIGTGQTVVGGDIVVR